MISIEAGMHKKILATSQTRNQRWTGISTRKEDLKQTASESR